MSRYIAIINNRLNLLIHSKSGNKILFKKINFKNDSLISYDIRDFTDKAVSHDWNEKLIRRLNQIYLDKKFDLKYLQKINFEKFDKIKENRYSSFKDFFKYKINLFWNLFPLTKKNNFFFHKIYIGSFFLSFKLYIGRATPLRIFSPFFSRDVHPQEIYLSQILNSYFKLLCSVIIP